jgi:hypothetical protein
MMSPPSQGRGKSIVEHEYLVRCEVDGGKQRNKDNNELINVSESLTAESGKTKDEGKGTFIGSK